MNKQITERLMAKLLILFLLVFLFVLLAPRKLRSAKNYQPPIQMVGGDDWDLVGEKGGCKLYTRRAIWQGRVYWSVCANGTSSVTAYEPD